MPIDLVSQMAGAAIRSAALGLVALVSLLIFRVRSPAARHAAWTVVLLGMLLQIFLEAGAPAVRLKLLPAAPVAAQPRVPAPESITQTPPATRMRMQLHQRRLSWREALTDLYLVVSLLLFLRLGLGSWGLRRVLRYAKPVGALGPGIFESPSLVVPGSVGCFRPKILLPAGWKDWDSVKLQAALTHESAHLRRKDWLIRVLSRANVCVFWFHPLAWWLERELALLSEEACDDIVLGQIEDRDQYAAILVDIARAAAAYGRVLNWGVISMARESNLTRRVNRILNCGALMPKPVRSLAWVTLVGCSLPIIYLSAAVKLVPAGWPSPPVRRENVPVSMCILIDSSGSMTGIRAQVIAAARALVQASKPGDEVCIIGFDDEPFNDLPSRRDFTGDIREMEQALTRVDSRGGTAMRDAVQMSIDHLQQKARHRRKVLVVIADGDDTSSSITMESLLRNVKHSGVPIYCIGLLHAAGNPRLTGQSTRALAELAAASGGESHYAKDLADVVRIAPVVARDLRIP